MTQRLLDQGMKAPAQRSEGQIGVRGTRSANIDEVGIELVDQGGGCNFLYDGCPRKMSGCDTPARGTRLHDPHHAGDPSLLKPAPYGKMSIPGDLSVAQDRHVEWALHCLRVRAA